MYYMMKQVVKSFRLEPGEASLLEFAAGAEGLTPSDLVRKAVFSYLLGREEFLKKRAKEMLNTLLYFEKSEEAMYIDAAKKAMALYPLENATLEFYIRMEKAKIAADNLVLKGFERRFAEEISQKFFMSESAEKQIFMKSLEDFIDGRDAKFEERLAEHYRLARKYILGLRENDL